MRHRRREARYPRNNWGKVSGQLWRVIPKRIRATLILLFLLIGMDAMYFFTIATPTSTDTISIAFLNVIFIAGLVLLWRPRKRKLRVSIPSNLQEQIFFRARGRCEMCGVKAPLEIHHRDNNPANNDKNNLIALCPNCHAKLTRGMDND